MAFKSKSAHANNNYERIIKSNLYCREQSGGGAGPGMMIGGILLGAVLTACGIIAWRKWNRRNGMGYQRSGFGGHSYQVTISAMHPEIHGRSEKVMSVDFFCYIVIGHSNRFFCWFSN